MHTHASRRVPLRALALLLLLAPGAALAQDRPAYVPTRDVTIDYNLVTSHPGPGVPKQVRAYITAGGTKARIEAPVMPGYLIVDRAGEHMFVIMDQAKMVMTLPFDHARVDMFTMNDKTAFARKGTDTVAGMGCTVWDISRDAHTAIGCISADGVILRGQSENNPRGSGSIVATAVSYAALPPVLFQPPAGYKQMEMPQLPPGVRPGMRMAPP